MTLTNLKTSAEIRSDNPLEAAALFRSTRRSYSARSSGLMPNDDQCVVLLPQEAEEFAAGILRDIDIPSCDKWKVCKLVACWLSGEISDQGNA